MISRLRSSSSSATQRTKTSLTTQRLSSTTSSDLKYLAELIEESPDALNTISSTVSETTRLEIASLRNKFKDTVIKASEPTRNQLTIYATNIGIPFIGFGIMDNAIMIIAGDQIDASLGVIFGISTMCAAAIGNILSDLCGVLFGATIEDFVANKFNLKDPNLSRLQMKLRSVRFAGQFGMGIGIAFGCVIGMFPLLYIDGEQKKKEEGLSVILRDVMIEAKTLIAAESTNLFLIDEDDGTLNNKEISAKIPLDEKKGGIIANCALRGLPVVVSNATKDRRFVEACDNPESLAGGIDSLLCVPVMNNEGHVIAVIQAINKQNNGTFTWYDEFLLQNLCNHVSVSLQELDNPHATRLSKVIELMKETERHEQDQEKKVLQARKTRRSSSSSER